ncbi:uncharacterized protein E0L32_004180 [Thyridium curvatum]|uniref:Uncharacterized protein n=1 Tax=Thyridium curvatum TaxID=1093900 RepID=A0A507AZC4_9PEZI|nr:uncharacterized protein E0L32_004180 [Thyridium curvatum]TPX16185.1 hypothetical protein E0L32_004180 [Thyridium curvatum]
MDPRTWARAFSSTKKQEQALQSQQQQKSQIMYTQSNGYGSKSSTTMMAAPPLPPPAVIPATLEAIAKTSHAMTDFVHSLGAFAHVELEPLAREMADLRLVLELLRDEPAVPRALHDLVAGVAGWCADALGRVDAVLAECREGPARSGRWAGKGKSEVAGLRARLEAYRRALALALEVATLPFPSNKDSFPIQGSDVSQEADAILQKINRLQAQIPQAEWGSRRSRFTLQSHLNDMAGYVEAVAGREIVTTYEIPESPYQINPGSRPVSRKSSLSLKRMRNALTRVATSESHTRSSSISSESTPSLDPAGSWQQQAPEEEFAVAAKTPSLIRMQHRTAVHPRDLDDLSAVRRGSHSSSSTANRVSKTSSMASEGFPTPAPTRPLPALPQTRRVSDHASVDSSIPGSPQTSRNSKSSRTASTIDRASRTSSTRTPLSPVFKDPTVESPPLSPKHVTQMKMYPTNSKIPGERDQPALQMDLSPSSTILSYRSGNNVLKIWSLSDEGERLEASIKFSFLVKAQTRSRDFFVRSHAILAEPTNLVAIATGFGTTVEVHNWQRKKKVQSFSDADRWASVRSDVFSAGWSPLAIYRAESDTISIYPAEKEGKKPFGKPYKIDLKKAGLPLLPKYPELAYSTTGPVLLAASGPRPPRLGEPPSGNVTMLMAWEIKDPAAVAAGQVDPHIPYKWLKPRHPELETALPTCLSTYGSVAVSIWIPAGYRSVPARGMPGGYQLVPVSVTERHVLVWELQSNKTSTFSIPDALSCVSPDCRLLAYCDPKGVRSGGRGKIAVLDVMSGEELWRWPSPELAPGLAGWEALEDLGQVADLAFSGDAGVLFVGGADGSVAMFKVQEGGMAAAAAGREGWGG